MIECRCFNPLAAQGMRHRLAPCGLELAQRFFEKGQDHPQFRFDEQTREILRLAYHIDAYSGGMFARFYFESGMALR